MQVVVTEFPKKQNAAKIELKLEMLGLGDGKD